MAKATDEYSVKVTADDQATKTLNNIGTNLKSGLGTLGKVGMLGLGVAAAGAGAAIGAFGAGLKFAIDEAIEAQQVQAQLQSVLTATGGVAGVTADQVNQIANSLMSVTRFTDEEIVSGESLLLTFKNIGSDVFPQVTEVMLDMSTAMGQDLKSSAIQLGKALNDPTQGLSALTRVGVTFTDAQKEEIKALQESGDLLGAQNILLQELQSEFGGSAKAAGETFAGQLDILKNQMSNVAEEAGNVLLPVLTEGLKSVQPIIMDLVNDFANFVKSDQFKNWVQSIVKWLKEDLPVAISTSKKFFNDEIKPVLQELIPIIRDYIVPGLKEVFHILGVVAPPIIKAFAIGWKIQIEIFKTIILVVENAITSIKNLFNLITGNADKMEQLKLPDWLTPGSPTPFEIGLRGINNELGNMFQLAPAAVSTVAPLAPGGGGGVAGSPVIVNINSPILGFSDKYELAQELGPIIAQYLARR